MSNTSPDKGFTEMRFSKNSGLGWTYIYRVGLGFNINNIYQHSIEFEFPLFEMM